VPLFGHSHKKRKKKQKEIRKISFMNSLFTVNIL